MRTIDRIVAAAQRRIETIVTIVRPTHVEKSSRVFRIGNVGWQKVVLLKVNWNSARQLQKCGPSRNAPENRAAKVGRHSQSPALSYAR
jgi:hypothetical protein